MNYKQLIFFLFFIGLTLSCKKDPLEVNPKTPISSIDSNFIFYPTKHALWIKKTYLETPIGIFNYLDTISIGKDTLMDTRTLDPRSNYCSDADSLSTKSYLELIVNGMEITPNLDTIYYNHRYGWFRQDIEGKKIYTPRFHYSDNTIYEDLKYDFSLEIGDTFFSPNSILIVNEIDSIAFGEKFLKHLFYGTSKQSEYSFEVIQGFNITAYNITGQGFTGTGTREWRKFIYMTDTLVIFN